MSDIYTDPPQSRNEAIIKSTIDGTQYTDPPQSRMEDLLLELKETIEQGGGGGTTVVANPEGEATDELEKLQVGSDIYGIPKDYSELDNKPSINSVELSGNKTASELGLQAELDGAQTVEGNPITVADAESMNAESVLVELEPKQDLHGYDAPWVGGAGKNKCDIESASAFVTSGSTDVVTLTKDEPSLRIQVDGATYAGAVVDLTIPNGTYTLNCGWVFNSSGIGCVQCFDSNDNKIFDSYTFSQDGALRGRQITVSDNFIRIRLFATWGGTTGDITYSNIQLEAGSTATSYEPYSNICPISGYSEVEVERVGKNLFDKNQTFAYNGYISSDGTLTASAFWRTTDYQLIKSGTYTMSGALSEDSAYYGICWYDSNKSYIGGFQKFDTAPQTVTIPSNAKYIRYCVNPTAFNTFQLEQGSTATTYEPYQGDIYTIDLDGTKYGGTLDVTEGKFIDDHGYATINYASLVDGLFRAQAPSGVNWSYPSCKCSCLEVWDTVNDLADNYGISYDDGYFYMNLPPECGETESAVQTWLQNNPIGVVYVTRDVTEESTTPTDIPLLENTNNISTDGTNITLKYQPNNVIGECKAYTDEQIEKVLPPLPTTDGTYHLSCEVSSGVGVLSWVSDS